MLLRVFRPACQLRGGWAGCRRSLASDSREWQVVEKVTDRQVPPLSNVTINASDCPVVVRPADPQQYPDSDRMLVYLLKDTEEDKTKLQFIQATSNTFNIDVQGDQAENKTLEIHIPVQSNVSAFCSGDGGFLVRDMHADRLSVVTSLGAINTRNIRCSEIVLATQGGAIISAGVLQGKINIKTLSQGTIDCQRIQGPMAVVESEHGDINISSDYCDKSSVTTHSGSIKFGSLHRKCKVQITGKGNLVAAGLDGRLQAMIHEGSAEVQISNLQGNSSLEVAKGSAKIQLGGCDNYEMMLSADEVTTSSDLQVERSTDDKDKSFVRLKQGDQVNGKMNVLVGAGSAQVEKSSWIASLNLRKSA